jgi:hypothetical protein
LLWQSIHILTAGRLFVRTHMESHTVPGCGASERSNLPSVKELSLIVLGNGLFWVIKLGDNVGVGDFKRGTVWKALRLAEEQRSRDEVYEE